MSKKSLLSLAGRMQELTQCSALVREGTATTSDAPVRVSWTPGSPDSGVFILVGDNASGKSLLMRILASWLNDDKVEPLQVSMRYRTEAGLHRAFMFGSESDRSTGAVSLHAVMGGLRTCRGRSTPSWLLLDEPDIGLAEGYSQALGQHLAEFGNELDGQGTRALGLVTHSKALVRSLTERLKHPPHVLVTGEHHAGMTLEQWLQDQRSRTLEELLSLENRGFETWRKVQKILGD